MKAEAISEILSKTNFIQELQKMFSGSELEDLAKETRFIERQSSRLTGEMFLKMNVCDFGESGGMSLTEKCTWLSEEYGVEMSKQSLDERYHTYAVKFMRACFERVLGFYMCDFEGIAGIKNKFSSVKVTDATSFKLPADLAVFYAGNGGDNGGSSVKIHQSYDLVKGQILDFHITDGKSNDTRYWEEGNLEISAGELQMADLGYYSLDYLQKIAQKEAYFITRYKTQTNLYIKNEAGELKALDLAATVSKIEENLDMKEVFLGKKQKIPVRLVIEKLPEDVKNKRLKKLKSHHANQSKQKKPYEISELKQLLCGYNLFLTNVSREVLILSQVVQFYRLRWQIELLFKIWKSLLDIDKISKMSIFRFECYLYGRLIAILLTNHIQSFLRDSFAHDSDIDCELSEWKTVKHLKKKY
jgi:hypothetical protein